MLISWLLEILQLIIMDFLLFLALRADEPFLKTPKTFSHFLDNRLIILSSFVLILVDMTFRWTYTVLINVILTYNDLIFSKDPSFYRFTHFALTCPWHIIKTMRMTLYFALLRVLADQF